MASYGGKNSIWNAEGSIHLFNVHLNVRSIGFPCPAEITNIEMYVVTLKGKISSLNFPHKLGKIYLDSTTYNLLFETRRLTGIALEVGCVVNFKCSFCNNSDGMLAC